MQQINWLQFLRNASTSILYLATFPDFSREGGLFYFIFWGVTSDNPAGEVQNIVGSSCLEHIREGGFSFYAQRWGELLQSKFLFVKGTIYSSAIEAFMRLHRLSLDATGHVWEANVFMALSLISQAIFFFAPPTCILRLYGVKPIRLCKASATRFRTIWSVRISRLCAPGGSWMSDRRRVWAAALASRRFYHQNAPQSQRSKC